MDPQLSLVIPFYNEERNVDALCQRLFPAAAAAGVPFEVVCVDDGSRDRTVELLRAQQKLHPELVLVRFARNHGQHAAITAGFASARGAWPSPSTPTCRTRPRRSSTWSSASAPATIW